MPFLLPIVGREASNVDLSNEQTEPRIVLKGAKEVGTNRGTPLKLYTSIQLGVRRQTDLFRDQGKREEGGAAAGLVDVGASQLGNHEPYVGNEGDGTFERE